MSDDDDDLLEGMIPEREQVSEEDLRKFGFIDDEDEFKKNKKLKSVELSMEMALLGVLEGSRIGGKYLLEVFMDEYEYEDAHINLEKATKPPLLLAKIKLPDITFLKDEKQEIVILSIKDNFSINNKLMKAINKWFRASNKYGQNNLEHSWQVWDEQKASKSFGQIRK